MGYILAGFLIVLGIETFIRILGKYEPDESKRHKCVEKVPWYGWIIGGVLLAKMFNHKKR